MTDSAAPTITLSDVAEPDLSIVIVAFGTGQELITTVESIGRTVTSRSLEVIVVSNPHPRFGQRSAAELRLFTRGVGLVEPADNTGFGGGCELGALFARGKLIAFVNPDVTVDPGWLDPLADTVEVSAEPVIAAPVLLDPDGSVQEAGQTLSRFGATRPNLDLDDDAIAGTTYSSAACWMTRRDDLERVGGFDPAYHPAYFEDVDLAWRYRRLGGRCEVVAASRVIHDRGRGTPDRAAPADAQRAILLRRRPEILWLAD